MKKVASSIITASFFSCLIILCVGLASCKKDSFITSSTAGLSTSTDSLKYDTVFTSVGSVTQSFKISNPNNQKLLLDHVKLMGGNTSSFTINVNGYVANEVSNIEMDAEDSIYVFVTVHINPNTDNLPFVVRDSVEITYNGNNRYVQLEAFGQNANFLRNRIITTNTVWQNTLPYVILGSLVIDTSATLTIEPGCKIYSHADAPIIVDGSLHVNGTVADKVVFAGDRLDPDYKDFPAGWPGIYFRESSMDNVLSNVQVKNAYQAIVAERLAANAQPKVTLHQCVIDNAYDAGILCVNSSLSADNTLISNCGNNVQLLYGGEYNFTNCTVAGYSTLVPHKNPGLVVSDNYSQGGSSFTADLAANFINCIFWGEESNIVENEIVAGKQGSNTYNVVFDHCLYRAKADPQNATITNSLANVDPLFDSIDVANRRFDFHTTINPSPVIQQGTATGFLFDLDGNSRNALTPDIGCYEKQ